MSFHQERENEIENNINQLRGTGIRYSPFVKFTGDTVINYSGYIQKE